jgi:ATP-dependent Clp protease protease subunit
MRRNYHLNSVLQETHDFCISYENREIYLHGHVGEHEDDLGVDFKMATRFLKNLRLLEKESKPITIHMYTYGGDVTAGFMIYDAIKNSPCNIAIVLHGTCMSMGTIIMQAADIRIAMPHCCFMIHDGSISIDGTNKQAEADVEFNKILRQQCLDIYVQGCKGGEVFQNSTETKIKKIIIDKMDKKEDWYLTADEALKYGFVDQILGTKFKTLQSIVQRN